MCFSQRRRSRLLRRNLLVGSSCHCVAFRPTGSFCCLFVLSGFCLNLHIL